MKRTCGACGALYDPAALTCDCARVLRGKLRDHRRTTRRLVLACLALMDGPGWREEYECEHGVPVGRPCSEASCSLRPVRRVVETIALYESGPCSPQALKEHPVR